jgi:hypothetical protein
MDNVILPNKLCWRIGDHIPFSQLKICGKPFGCWCLGQADVKTVEPAVAGRLPATSTSQILQGAIRFWALHNSHRTYPVPVVMSTIRTSGFGRGMSGWRLNRRPSFQRKNCRLRLETIRYLRARCKRSGVTLGYIWKKGTSGLYWSFRGEEGDKRSPETKIGWY